MKALIVGCRGEVGEAIRKMFVLNSPDVVVGVDKSVDEVDNSKGSYRMEYEPEAGINDNYDVLHICIPYSEKFASIVKGYFELHNPKYIVIHSTVPVGTTRKIANELGIIAVHSPIRGIHPFLYEGVRTFKKMIGGPADADLVQHFRHSGFKVQLFETSETTEAAKLFDTEYYRACIEFMQRVRVYCLERGLRFHEVYTLPNQSYNEGYAELGHPEFIRPILQPIPGEIGGHCVLPNKELLNITNRQE